MTDDLTDRQIQLENSVERLKYVVGFSNKMVQILYGEMARTSTPPTVVRLVDALHEVLKEEA